MCRIKACRTLGQKKKRAPRSAGRFTEVDPNFLCTMTEHPCEPATSSRRVATSFTPIYGITHPGSCGRHCSTDHPERTQALSHVHSHRARSGHGTIDRTPRARIRCELGTHVAYKYLHS
ncbi:hypothetical protein PAXRUDRAFT_729163 [Paxillus rubicundulus Ve08.2h10]|uniref:Uncharacterized protein n=1 Tax=Paxillus rubicundulus Ve08.2h10 TaxID=930991 RepID=A0A0D0DCX0_9AGAM|nr:hypothetical protein PAXRUDRAFT_729163 [Paxillus rubicundulus Ve08.2h10]